MTTKQNIENACKYSSGYIGKDKLLGLISNKPILSILIAGLISRKLTTVKPAVLVNEEWTKLRTQIIAMLSEEAQLEEMVKLIGMDALSPADRLMMESSRTIREDFLHQLAFHDVDTYTSAQKQYMMMKIVCEYYNMSLAAIENGAEIEKVLTLPVREKIGRFKYIKQELTVKADYDIVAVFLIN